MTKVKNLDRRYITILLIVFVQILGASMVMPILPLYALRQFEMDPLYIPLLGTSFFIAQAIAGPYLGRLSDKYGRVPVLIISQIGTVISFIMIGLANSVLLLFAARILDGITGGNIIVAQAYITDITPREKRTQALGMIFAAFGLGFIFGPALGTVLAAYFGPTVPFYLAAVAAAVVVLLTWRTLDESLTPEQRQRNRQANASSLQPRQVWANRTLVLVLLIAFVGQFVLGMLQSTFALFGATVLFAGYTQKITDMGIGLLLSVVGMSQFMTQLVVLPRMLRRYNDTTIVIVGLLVRGLGMLVFTVITWPWFGIFGSIFFAVGMGLMMPPLQSLSTKAVGDELRGGVLGVYQSVISVSTIVSTAVSGLLFTLNPRLPYGFAVGLTLVALAPALILQNKFRKQKEEVLPVVTD
jgi:DHA1 family tetracycline resistance protein-like MFS transporter